MTLSSKFTISLIVITALFIGGSGLTTPDAYAADAPEFTAAHINTTATKITFDQNINGTLRILDWALKTSSTVVAGEWATDVVISNIANGTISGHSLDGILAYSDTASAVNKAALGTGTSGFMNNSKVIILRHSAIDTDSTYFVNYTGNPLLNNNVLREGSLSHTVAGAVGLAVT